MPIHMAMLSETVSFWRFGQAKQETSEILWSSGFQRGKSKLTWLVLGGDPAVRSRRVKQLTAL